MVVYDLICEENHDFEGWFKSSDDFQHQQNRGLLECPFCESKNVRKLPTASYISTPKNSHKTQASNKVDEQKIIRDLKNYIVNNTEDVGQNFAEEAKKIHYGEVKPRNIRGSANQEEVKALSEEGIEVISLPGTVTEKQKLN